MEKIFKDEGIVLRRSYVGDYDLSLTVYFKKYGKENIYIHKGQMIRSPYITSTEKFNWIKGVFLYKKDKVYIKEIDRFENLAFQISKKEEYFTTAFFFSSIFNKYVLFPDEKMFIFLKKAFYYLTKAKIIENHRINFLSKLVYLSGVYPIYDSCVMCTAKINKRNFGIFSEEHSGVICKKCLDNKKQSDFSYEDIKILKILKDIQFSSVDKLRINNTKKFEKFFLNYLNESI
ncbi:DNA repair protein RecO [Persephonella sp.]